MFVKSSKISKKVGNAVCPLKKVDNDVLCPINVISEKFLLAYFLYFWTNLGPILVELIFEYILRPQCNKSRIYADLTNIVIISQTIALLGGAFSICPKTLFWFVWDGEFHHCPNLIYSATSRAI